MIDRTEYFLHNKRHREGLAVECDGIKELWLNGEYLTEKFNCMTPAKITVAEVGELLGYMVKIVK